MSHQLWCSTMAVGLGTDRGSSRVGWQQGCPQAGVRVPSVEGRVLSAAVLQPKPTKGRMRIHCLENVDKALQFLKEQRVHLENMGSHDIVDGNHRLVLGLIWTIILRFQVGGGHPSAQRPMAHSLLRGCPPLTPRCPCVPRSRTSSWRRRRAGRRAPPETRCCFGAR